MKMLIVISFILVFAIGDVLSYDNLRQTVSPQDAKVGDTVTITCSYTAPVNSYFIEVNRRRDGIRKGIATNSYINYEFQKTRRYTAEVELENKGSQVEFTVKITITDVQVKDSGTIGCLVPAVGLIHTQDFTVSEASGVGTTDVSNYNGLHLTISPQDAEVGDTVTITCSYTGPVAFFIEVDRTRNGMRREIATNTFIYYAFKETGRYTAAGDVEKKGSATKFTSKITITDVQVEDSGRIECRLPLVGLVHAQDLTVSQAPEVVTEGMPSLNVVGLEMTVTPEDGKVGDTVAVTCTLTAPELSSLNMRVTKRANGQTKEVFRNNLLRREFANTGRFSDEILLSRRSGSKEMKLIITIKDVQPEDAGEYRCEVPSQGLMNLGWLNVSE